MEPKKVAVIGAGTMGNGIAHVCALAGMPVALCDVSSDALGKGLATIHVNMERQVKKGSLTEEDRTAALNRISTSTSLASAVEEADFAIEAATESKDVKQEIFRLMDLEAPEWAVLASNTSSISITELAASTERPERVIGMHFMNPVPVIKLVEVICGPATSDATLAATIALCGRLGKTPVKVSDYPGFAVNRLLIPMLNEAMFCVMEGVASPEGIDAVMTLGMNHPMGPLKLADLIGLDVCLAIMEQLHEGFGDPKYRPCPLLRRMVAAGELGRKSGKGFYRYDEGGAS